MPKFNLLSICCLLLTLSSITQAQVYNNYDIAKFKNSELNISGLDFSIYGGANGGSYTSELLENSEADENMQSFSGALNGLRQYRKGSVEYVGKMQIYTNFGHSYQDTQNDNLEQNKSTKSFSRSLMVSSNNRFYHKVKFIDLAPETRYSYKDNNNEQSNKSWSQEDVFENDSLWMDKVILRNYKLHRNDQLENYSISLPVSLGYGKLENVNSARVAIYILEELNNTGYLNGTLSHEEIDRIAQQISTIKNKRLFDSREKAKYQISALDSILFATGKISKRDVGYFNVINDNWMYGNTERLQGWEIGVTSGYTYGHELLKNNENDNSVNEVNVYNYNKSTILSHLTNSFTENRILTDRAVLTSNIKMLGCFLNYSDQINLFNQYSFNISASKNWDYKETNQQRDGITTKTDSTSTPLIMSYKSSSKYNYDEIKTNISLTLNHDWFPNTRTIMSNSLSVQYSETESKNKNDFTNYEYEYSSENYTYNYQTSVKYYFSENVTGHVAFNLFYNKLSNRSQERLQESDVMRYYINLGVNYTLF